MSTMVQINYYSGTSGLILPVPNKLAYPIEFQNSSRLSYYASLLNSIEINSSFYKVPMSSTVKKWAESVPDDFRFTFKLWRDITHNKGLFFNPEAVDHFMQTIAGIGSKKACLLVQFPPSLKINHSIQLEKLMSRIRQADQNLEWKVALEFRHPSLYHQDMYDLLDHYDMGIVMHDKPPAITPLEDINAPFIYLRFHGPDGSYRRSYQDYILYEYAQYIKDWIAESKTVYAYFNNTMGDAIKNLMTLKNYVEEACSE